MSVGKVPESSMVAASEQGRYIWQQWAFIQHKRNLVSIDELYKGECLHALPIQS